PDENDEAEEHADAGGAEAIAPAIGLAQVSGRNGAERRADVDAHIEDCVSAVAANVSARIKLPDDDRDVRLQKARSHDDEGQREPENIDRRITLSARALERHQEMTECQQHRAEEH